MWRPFCFSRLQDVVGHLRTIKDAGDNTSAGALEKRLGDDTANVVTQNRPRWFAWLKSDKQHEAEHPHRRPLLLTQEVLQIPADEEIILRSRHEARACAQDPMVAGGRVRPALLGDISGALTRKLH